MLLATEKPCSFSEACIKMAEKIAALDLEGRQLNNREPYRIEVQIRDFDFLLWLNHQDNAVKIFWEDRDKNFMIAGLGAADTITAKDGEDVYETLSRMTKSFSSHFPQMQYFGGFSFDSRPLLPAEWKNWGRARFVLPQFEIRKTGNAVTLACNIIFNKDFPKNLKILTRQLLDLRNPPNRHPSLLAQPFHRLDIPNAAAWKKSAADIINAINQKKFQKIVLARSVRLDFKSAVNPFLLMARLRETTANCFCFIFQFQNDESFLGATPERLYQRKNDRIETEAIAGTRPRGEETAEDILMQNDLLSSKKDHKEQKYVVEMIQKSLLPLCVSLRADENPSLLNWSAGHHLITRFDGLLKKNSDDRALISQLHPTPAVAGTPSLTALNAINRIEIFSRGWYCGPVGFIGLNHSELAVAIRSTLLREKSAYLYAGAGLIKESSPEAEWEETENKLGTFLKIFNVTQK